MKAQVAQAGDLCVDIDEPLDQTTCTLFRSRGIRGVWRYLSDLTTGEVATIIASGLILYFVNHSRLPGWIPSAAEGALDAKADIANLQRLGVPTGVHVFFDLEGVGGGAASVANLIAHLSAYASAITAAGYTPAIYVGDQSLLTSAQLYALAFFLYWHSASHVVDVTGAEAGPECGWSVYQGSIIEVKLFNVTIDWDFVSGDFHGRLPVGVAA
jgi:hypothetical protein